MEKVYFTAQDIRDRYGVGKNTAYRIMREIIHMTGKSIGRGKVLRTQVEEWERRMSEK